MVLNINISPEAQAGLQAKALSAGVDMATYAARHLELLVRPAPSLQEISGPIGEAFAQSGATEDELADFLEQEKHAVRAQRNARLPA
jgi:hypothetical protein